MVKRIYVSPSAFKISKPGYDATVAAGSNLLFSGFDSRYSGVYTQGSAVVDGTWSTVTVASSAKPLDNMYRLYKDITFDRTFSVPPQVLCIVKRASESNYIYKYNYSKYLSGQTASCAVGAASYVDKIRLFFDCNYTSASAAVNGFPYATGWTFAYRVFFL